MVGTLYDNDGVTVLEENHFNSWNSQLWRRVRNTFSVDLENMYRTLRSNGLFTLENMLTYFDAVTDIISPKMYNDSQQIKYINDGAVGMVALHGNRKLQIRKWLRERIAYLDSKYGYYAGGGVGENYCNFRMNYQGAVSLDLTTYYTVYAKVRWATNNEQTIRIARGQKKTFSYYSDVGTDREVMIFLPESLKTIENISKIYPNSIDVSKATKLTQIEAHNTNLFSVDLSKNKYLRKIDFNGCERLGTETATMTLNFCKYLNEVDLRGTQITAVNFNTKGGSLRKIYFPKTIQSVNLLNQLLLTDMVLPYGEDGSNAPTELATITIENCPNVQRLIDTSTDISSLNAMKYCRNLTLNNAIKLEKFNFYGFTRLANVNLQNMETLKEVDLLNMTKKGEETSLRYIGVSACPILTKISMNCDDPNYEITWAKDSLLDLQTAGGIEEISSNCIIKGLETIVVPRTIKGMYFTNEYGEGYSDIKNIWSAEASTIVKTGVFPIPYHLNSENVTDEYEGIDFRGLKLSNIDLGALVNIPDAINFSLYPTNVNPNFNLYRDGVTLPYLQPKGMLDLSNYTGSLAKFFNGVDLNKMILICNKQLPQTDLSYCFYNCFFDDESAITPLTDHLSDVVNLDYCFYKSVVTINVLEQFTIGSNASLNYTFGECSNITELDGIAIPVTVKSSEGLFYKCAIKTITNTRINTNGSCKEIFKDNKRLAEINNLTMNNATSLESAFENCSSLNELPFKEINDRVTNIAKMYYNCGSPSEINDFVFGSSIIDSTDWISKELIESANNITIKNNTMNFEGFTNLVSCDNLLITSNVKTLANYFKGDIRLNSLSFNASSDFRNVTSMAYMLDNCSSITSSPINEIPDNIQNIDYMYNGTGITSLDNLIIGSGVTSATNWNPTNLKSANNMVIKNNYVKFTGVTSLQSAENLTRPNSSDWSSFFEGCISLRNDVVFPNTVTTVKNCFKGCISLAYVHNNWDKIYVHGITSTDCYAGCTGITHIDGLDLHVGEFVKGLDGIPPDWGGYGMYPAFTTIAEFDIDESNLSLTLTVSDEDSVLFDDKVVNWGDGSITYGEITHTYTNTGKYIVKGKYWFENVGRNWSKRITRLIKVPYGVEIDLYYRFCQSSLLTYVNLTNAIIIDANNAFNMYGCINPLLSEIIFDNSTFLYGASLNSIFTNNKALTQIDLSGIILEGNNILSNLFNGNANIKTITGLNNLNTKNVTTFQNAFNGCTSLLGLDFTGCDFSNVTNLTTFVGNNRVLTYFKAPSNIKVSLSNFTNSTLLTTEDLITIIENLAIVDSTQTLTLGSNNLSKLTAEQIKIATDKNWSVV